MAETLPPMTLDELNTALDNPHFSTYVYIGAENDKGWKMALAIFKLLPALRIYRVASSSAATIRQTFNVPNTHVGVVFGWDREVKETLTKAKSTDFFAVSSAITNARA
jgi:hypothetical protein